jgi:hypothetical protein
MRVFNDRMDLIRAVIIGASGTPYRVKSTTTPQKMEFHQNLYE